MNSILYTEQVIGTGGIRVTEGRVGWEENATETPGLHWKDLGVRGPMTLSGNGKTEFKERIYILPFILFPKRIHLKFSNYSRIAFVAIYTVLYTKHRWWSELSE